jgi:NitT/TauT family transport system ATP-binding protein
MDRVAGTSAARSGEMDSAVARGETAAAREPITSPASAEPAIELSHVSMHFELERGETVRALTDVSLRVEPGEFLCIVGPSGHGKTTMMNLIAGFLAPTRGEVRTFGHPVGGPGADRGVVFQRDTLFLWKRVRDNICFGLKARGVPKRERDAIVERYLELIGLERFGGAWPKQLSGGMRRRVAIAAVFANEPRVLLMDEPFVGLDYVRRADLHSVLLELWKRSHNTAFFITHDVDEALALGDRVIVVVDGQITHEAAIPFPRPRTAETINSEEGSAIRLEVLSHMELGAGTV